MTDWKPSENEQDPIAKATGVSLYPQDLERVELIRKHYGLDSFSQAVRRAIKVATALIDSDASADGRAA